MRYRVQHNSRYKYQEPVSLCYHEVHLHPRNGLYQVCQDVQLAISPHPTMTIRRQDFFGNHVSSFTLQENHSTLEVSCISEVEVTPFVPPMADVTTPWEDVRDLLAGPEACRHLEATQYIFESTYVRTNEQLADYAHSSFSPRRPVVSGALDLMRRIHTEYKYDPTATTVATPVMDVFHQGRGVCQDFAHLMLSCLRSIGLAGRYVSGYLLTTPPPGKEKLVGADASHAWLSIYCPGFGWVDLDPTNNVIPSDKHVLVAWGRDYADVSPIKGVILGGGQHTVEVSVSVGQI
jgi:transglutaminase-like putative cysteine protease